MVYLKNAIFYLNYYNSINEVLFTTDVLISKREL